MKHLFFTLLFFPLFISCESETDKTNATNEKYSREIVAILDKDVENIFDNRKYELEPGLALVLYSNSKLFDQFIGLSIRPWAVAYCTSNAFDCSFHGEGDPIWEDKKRKIEVRYGDMHYNLPVIKNDTVQPFLRSSVGTGTEKVYQHHMEDVIRIYFWKEEIILYFKAKKKLKGKFEEGQYWAGPSVSTSNAILLDR